MPVGNRSVLEIPSSMPAQTAIDDLLSSTDAQQADLAALEGETADALAAIESVDWSLDNDRATAGSMADEIGIDLEGLASLPAQPSAVEGSSPDGDATPAGADGSRDETADGTPTERAPVRTPGQPGFGFVVAVVAALLARRGLRRRAR